VKAKLKPCPFCGSDAEIMESGSRTNNFAVRCPAFDVCEISPSTDWWLERGDAIDAWNKRDGDPQ
jgi:hypothetical protein